MLLNWCRISRGFIFAM